MSCRLYNKTLELAEDYLDFCAGVQQVPPSKEAEAMRHLAKDMEKQYQAKFQALMQNFMTCCSKDPSDGLRKVIVEMVGDGILNWGRVVSLFTFSGVLAHELCSRKEQYRGLAKTIAEYLGGEKEEWLMQNEGWEGFCKFFHTSKEVNQESSMKTALFAAAGVGIAGITFLLVR